MLRQVITAVLLLTVTASAQSPEEIKFKKKQADQLHKYAEFAFKKGYPQNAKRVWLMLLSEYDADHTDAREALGFEKVGKSLGII